MHLTSLYIYLSVCVFSFLFTGARCSSVVRALGRRTHRAISRSSQCSTTGVTKAVVCAILSVG